jgi:hypothetical protein
MLDLVALLEIIPCNLVEKNKVLALLKVRLHYDVLPFE